jgi:hypothetical protein
VANLEEDYVVKFQRKMTYNIDFAQCYALHCDFTVVHLHLSLTGRSDQKMMATVLNVGFVL